MLLIIHLLISALFLLFLHGNFKFHLRKYCLTFLFRTMRFFRHFSLQQVLLVFNVEKISNKECLQLNWNRPHMFFFAFSYFQISLKMHTKKV